jgi:CHAT domain-containing protein/tetratricopeptide (TPR) repeat protein
MSLILISCEAEFAVNRSSKMNRIVICILISFALFFWARESQAQAWGDSVTRADSLAKAGHFMEARNLVLELLATEGDRRDTSVASLEHKCGIWSYRLDDYTAAEKYFSRALDLRQNLLGPTHLDVAKTWYNLGLVYWNQNRFDDAEHAYKQAIFIREIQLGADHQELAVPLRNLAIVLTDQARYQEAEQVALRALSIDRKTYSTETVKTVPALNTLATVYWQEGRFKEAEDTYLEAIRLRENALGRGHPDVMSLLNNLASLYDATREYARAESLFTYAIEVQESSVNPDSMKLAVALSNLSKIQMRLEQWTQAETSLERAVQICNSLPQVPELTRAGVRLRMATLYDNTGIYDRAKLLAEESVTTRQIILGSSHPEVAQANATLAVVYRHLGLWNKALPAAEAAYSVAQENLHDVAQTLSESKALQFARWAQLQSGDYLSILLDMPNGPEVNREEIAATVFTNKGQVTNVMLARHAATQVETDSSAIALIDSLRVVREKLASEYARPSGDATSHGLAARLQDLTAKRDSLEGELAQAVTMPKAGVLSPVKAQAVSAGLPPNSALIEYYQYNHRTDNRRSYPHYLAVVIGSNGKTLVVPLGPSESVDSAVTRYELACLPEKVSDFDQYAVASRALYELVWLPVINLVADAELILIAPDGMLNKVSFAGLIDDNGRYLVESHAIHYLTAGRDLLKPEDDGFAGSGLMAIGDPDFDFRFADARTGEAPVGEVSNYALLGLTRNVRAQCEGLRELSATPLPATRAEIEAVVNRWKQSTDEDALVYLGQDASEENFKKQSHGKRVLHVATHGFYLPEQCAAKLDDSGEFSALAGESPLLLSGLLLAGANQRDEPSASQLTEDGILTAEEISSLDLRGTDLAVLSACQTGLGVIKSGEGVYGLRRALIASGVRSVISTLWSVDDKSTAELLGNISFHRGESIPNILRQTQLQQIEQLRAQGKSDHPFYWAGFVASGALRMR